MVAFVEGDPDQPIIVGSVYNADQLPPYDLPDDKTNSTIKTRSSEKGTTDNFNEIRFEDKKDSEEIFIHAEKDFNRVVKNNDTLKVGFIDEKGRRPDDRHLQQSHHHARSGQRIADGEKGHAHRHRQRRRQARGAAGQPHRARSIKATPATRFRKAPARSRPCSRSR